MYLNASWICAGGFVAVVGLMAMWLALWFIFGIDIFGTAMDDKGRAKCWNRWVWMSFCTPLVAGVMVPLAVWLFREGWGKL